MEEPGLPFAFNSQVDPSLDLYRLIIMDENNDLEE